MEKHYSYDSICLKFRKGGKEDKFGIWVGFDCCDLLVDPISLGNSLFESQKWQRVYNNGDASIYSRVWSEVKECCWVIERGNTMHRYRFNISEYVDSVYDAIYNLRNAIGCSDIELEYDFSRKHLDQRKIVSQFDLLINQIMIMRKAIISPRLRSINILQIEPFSFSFIEDYTDATSFVIKVGTREYVSCLYDSGYSLEMIRHQLENVVYERESQIDIYNDTLIDATSIRLEKESLKEFEQNIVRVTIFPDEYNRPIISGYCDSKQVVRALYQGLLGITRLNLDEDMRGEIADWCSYRLNIYNKLKSPLIEQYINRSRIYKQDDYITRQYHIKDIITINIDADADLWHNAGYTSGVLFEDTFEIDNLSIRIDGFQRWRGEFTKVVDWTTSTVEDEFDWEAWHKRGLELAQQMRQQLPNEYDLWYSAPYEDKSGTLKEDVLIIKQ